MCFIDKFVCCTSEFVIHATVKRLLVKLGTAEHRNAEHRNTWEFNPNPGFTNSLFIIMDFRKVIFTMLITSKHPHE